MRLMSFSMTHGAFLNGTKTVTRRVGWKSLKAGDVLMAVEKAQGLKKGEHVVKLGPFEVVTVRREPLGAIRDEILGTALEGFPLMSADAFLAHFCKAMGTAESDEITRIEFRRCLAPLALKL